jgi:hypothetical protein
VGDRRICKLDVILRRVSANAIVGMLTPGFLMMAVAFLGFESTERLLISLMIGIGAIADFSFSEAT